jgi:hypothetical protein
MSKQAKNVKEGKFLINCGTFLVLYGIWRQSAFLLTEIIKILRWKLGLVDLKKFNQNFIRSWNHNILPES